MKSVCCISLLPCVAVVCTSVVSHDNYRQGWPPYHRNYVCTHSHMKAEPLVFTIHGEISSTGKGMIYTAPRGSMSRVVLPSWKMIHLPYLMSPRDNASGVVLVG